MGFSPLGGLSRCHSVSARPSAAVPATPSAAGQEYSAMSRPRTFPIVLAGFTAFLDLYATQPLLPLLMRVFNATHVAVSLTVTASTVAVALGAPVVGRLADLIGRKRVIVGSSLGLALGRSEEHTSELQSHHDLVCRLLPE